MDGVGAAVVVELGVWGEKADVGTDGAAAAAARAAADVGAAIDDADGVVDAVASWARAMACVLSPWACAFAFACGAPCGPERSTGSSAEPSMAPYLSEEANWGSRW